MPWVNFITRPANRAWREEDSVSSTTITWALSSSVHGWFPPEPRPSASLESQPLSVPQVPQAQRYPEGIPVCSCPQTKPRVISCTLSNDDQSQIQPTPALRLQLWHSATLCFLLQLQTLPHFPDSELSHLLCATNQTKEETSFQMSRLPIFPVIAVDSDITSVSWTFFPEFLNSSISIWLSLELPSLAVSGSEMMQWGLLKAQRLEPDSLAGNPAFSND